MGLAYSINMDNFILAPGHHRTDDTKQDTKLIQVDRDSSQWPGRVCRVNLISFQPGLSPSRVDALTLDHCATGVTATQDSHSDSEHLFPHYS